MLATTGIPRAFTASRAAQILSDASALPPGEEMRSTSASATPGRRLSAAETSASMRESMVPSIFRSAIFERRDQLSVKIFLDVGFQSL